MNRLLLAAATALATVVSSQALAASYTLDSFEGANSLTGSSDPNDNYVMLDGTTTSSTVGGIASYVSDGFTLSRSVNFTQTALANDTAWSFLTISGYGTPGDASVQVMNFPDTNSVLKLTYGIGGLGTLASSGAGIGFNVNIISTDANVGQSSYVDAYLNGSSTAFASWELTAPVNDSVPATEHTFNVSAADIHAGSEITFALRGATAYNTSIAPLTFDVMPVPELGLLPMFGSGLLVVGFAAARRRRIAA